jgi:hypothetical protein
MGILRKMWVVLFCVGLLADIALDPNNDVVDSVSYGPVDEDEVVIRGN